MTTPALIEARGLPENPLDAAASFHNKVLPAIRAAIATSGGTVIAFDPAGHEHYNWRLAVTQELAREAAPARVNAIVGESGETLHSTLAFIASAPGVTGQIFTLA